MDENELNTFDFVTNDEDEVMLLLHAQETEPKNPRIEFDFNDKSAVLIRNDTDEILLEGIPDDVIDSLQDADNLMICELQVGKTDNDTKIIYAYEADITT